MDGTRFDTFARLVGATGTRRGLLKALAAFTAAAIAGARGRTTAASATCRDRGRLCREHANCCGGHCLAPDATGRRRCACTAPGQTCQSGADCCDRPCYQGICQYIPTGYLCTADAQCSSSSCDPSDDGLYCFPNGAGGACRVAGDCITGLCQQGICACSPSGGVCADAGDCCSGPCYQGFCQYIPFDHLCATDAECSSNACRQVDIAFKACVANGAGGFCRASTDCLSGQCNGNVCT